MPEILRWFHPVLPVRRLGSRPRAGPVRVLVDGHPLALFRDAEGRPAALDDTCPHRRAPLSRGTVRPNGRLACPYHGWNFDRHGEGRSPTCPDATHCRTPAYRVEEHHGFLWVATGDAPPVDLRDRLQGPDGTGFSSAAFSYAGSVSTRFEAPLDLTLDNVTEAEHFAFVHSTFAWSEEGAGEVEVETLKHPDRTEVSCSGVQRFSPWGYLGGVKPGDRFFNRWTTRFDPVRTHYEFGWTDPSGERQRPVVTRVAVYLVPETEGTTWAHMFIFVRIAPPLHLLRPAIAWMSRHIARTELLQDAALMRHVAEAPSTLQGMRLTRHDKALVHNRRLLETVYRGARESRPRPELAPETSASPPPPTDPLEATA